MEVKILQIPESDFNKLLIKVDRIEAGQQRIISDAETQILFTGEEVCKILKCSLKTLQNWRDRGLIEYIQLGSVVRYSKNH